MNACDDSGCLSRSGDEILPIKRFGMVPSTFLLLAQLPQALVLLLFDLVRHVLWYSPQDIYHWILGMESGAKLVK